MIFEICHLVYMVCIEGAFFMVDIRFIEAEISDVVLDDDLCFLDRLRLRILN